MKQGHFRPSYLLGHLMALHRGPPTSGGRLVSLPLSVTMNLPPGFFLDDFSPGTDDLENQKSDPRHCNKNPRNLSGNKITPAKH